VVFIVDNSLISSLQAPRQTCYPHFGSYANPLVNSRFIKIRKQIFNELQMKIPPTSRGDFEFKKWVKLSLKNKALRHRQKIFTTNNHYEWSKNQSCRICHDRTPGLSLEERETGANSYYIQNETRHLKKISLSSKLTPLLLP